MSKAIELDDDGFIKVENKFNYKSFDVKSKSKQRRKGKKKYFFKDCNDWDLNDLKTTLAQRKEALLESRFYSDLMEILNQSLLPREPQDIVCYGIGSMQKSKNAQYQFILALVIRDLLKIPGRMSIYDPVMTELDKEICQFHDIDVIAINEDGKRSVTKPTLFYMPHCGRGLYSNTLSSNWNPTQLTHTTILGNRFDMYVGSQLDKDLKRECPYLIPAVKIVEAVPFPPKFDNNQIFNDLSIQWFPQDKMSAVEKTFWDVISTEDLAPMDADTLRS
ncbi:SRR1-domain-containing protein [Radiomyces spectabilis]|uniref:SRR1-domain-containing protein n=1 Tax=Radiomyces spectabilis TaxID=64574 RepID=UPI00222054DD|nr:SRR1-domain-containing protein [Radiomyces spectabilis]KAI8393280.1 SRR1-domain-containing protein [Radiomyces spectabilis]